MPRGDRFLRGIRRLLSTRQVEVASWPVFFAPKTTTCRRARTIKLRAHPARWGSGSGAGGHVDERAAALGWLARHQTRNASGPALCVFALPPKCATLRIVSFYPAGPAVRSDERPQHRSSEFSLAVRARTARVQAPSCSWRGRWSRRKAGRGDGVFFGRPAAWGAHRIGEPHRDRRSGAAGGCGPQSGAWGILAATRRGPQSRGRCHFDGVSHESASLCAPAAVRDERDGAWRGAARRLPSPTRHERGVSAPPRAA